ncbi:hypothetical protein GCM10009117_10570 [Gangjinia marincola]|uniref:UvrD-like helicase ATP-binding domain-containing protein n=1 Tax=Gangjinia marincola TaxID=578463 RepID=A0ABN1MFH4_9FLAO
MNRYLLFFLFITTPFSFSQVLEETKEEEEMQRTLLSDAIELNMPRYNNEVYKAKTTDDMERIIWLADSLITHCIVGTYLDDFNINSLRSRHKKLHEFEKPVYLITYSKFIAESKDKPQLTAINELVKNHHDKIDFVLLFWNEESDVKKIAKKYHQKVHIAYIDERQNTDPYIIKILKHSLGYPMTYLVGDSKQILSVKKPLVHHIDVDETESFNMHFNELSKGVSILLSNTEEPKGEPQEDVTTPETPIDQDEDVDQKAKI